MLLSVCMLCFQWDYHEGAIVEDGLPSNASHLLRVLGDIEAAGVPVMNPLSTVRWNISKRYLRELAAAGVSTIDTLWVDELSSHTDDELQEAVRARGWHDGVLKPQTSASGNNTTRFVLSESRPPGTSSLGSALEAARASGTRSWMIQPFCSEVLTDGELSFVFLDAVYSHGVLKKPAGAVVDDGACASPAASDAATAFMVQEHFGGTKAHYTPSQALIAQATSMLHACEPGRTSLYARVDCLRRGERLLLSELELLEPHLYNEEQQQFNARFVHVVERKIKEHHARRAAKTTA